MTVETFDVGQVLIEMDTVSMKFYMMVKGRVSVKVLARVWQIEIE